MTKTKKQALAAVALTLSIVLIDQIIKFSVKTGMYLGEQIEVTSWFRLVFVENNGMAFGWEFMSKYLLTAFRIVFSGVIAWYMWREIRRGVEWGFLICLSLLVAGAVGNIIDCLFYGLIFTNPTPPEVAQLVPFGEGYGTFMLGRVVDMFYFPLVEWDWPSWMPLWGGEHFIFFSPVFNFADASISVGMVALLLFYYKKLL
ncbi:MAG: lipoprotein signal peptidase [Bacteroidaceae bacterium]|nr:lipoprotein signal peptidase [Bacteroidaceae bacterium]